MNAWKVIVTAIAFLIFVVPAEVPAQRGQRGARPPREAAAFDVTGYWVSVVSEDWRVRMLMGQKDDWLFMMGRYGSLNEEGLRVANSADPAREDPCKAYGAAGVMRIPGRLRITWENDSTLRIDTDAGMQTRILHFSRPQAPPKPARQGLSIAAWEGGKLKVTTNGMLPGYYFKHGVPYSGDAVMTEYLRLMPGTDKHEPYLFVTTTVTDPQYLNGTYDRTLTFKREPDGAKWNPAPCSVP
jgi:hypothetical protein